MKRNAVLLVLVCFSLFFGLNTVFAQRGRAQQETIEIRLASTRPRNSNWGRTLDLIAAEWARVTDNQVRVLVIHNGMAGDEDSLIAPLRSDNIQAALITPIGISEICPPVMTLRVPFLISNNTELDMVLQEILPVLDNYMSRTDFVAVCWYKGGWFNLFSREPVFEPDNLRRQRLSSDDVSRDINDTFRTMGINVGSWGVLGGDATYSVPESIASMGLHKDTAIFSTPLKNMLDLPIAPLLGAIVMNRVTWDKLGAERQRSIVAATQRLVLDVVTSESEASASAVTAMQRNGLRVNRPSQAQIEMWRAEINRVIPSLLGTVYDRDVYNRITQILARVRNR